jgi:hypothetical protein
MRIKSYFAGSIQTAMRQARDEFGDDVMLVTSRVTDPEIRHLGEYEVVLAVDGEEHDTKRWIPAPAVTGFERILRDQFQPARIPDHLAREAAVEAVRLSLIDIGLEPQTMEALLAVIKHCAPPDAACHSQVVSSAAPAEISQGETAKCHLLPPSEVTSIVTGLTVVADSLELASPEYPGQALAEACSEATPFSTTGLDCVSLGLGVEGPLTVDAGEQILSNAQKPAQSQIEEQRVRYPVPCPRATPKGYAKSGYMMLLIAFALYGITRPSGS